VLTAIGVRYIYRKGELAAIFHCPQRCAYAGNRISTFPGRLRLPARRRYRFGTARFSDNVMMRMVYSRLAARGCVPFRASPEVL
jgi:hypothetical protein